MLGTFFCWRFGDLLGEITRFHEGLVWNSDYLKPNKDFEVKMIKIASSSLKVLGGGGGGVDQEKFR